MFEPAIHAPSVSTQGDRGPARRRIGAASAEALREEVAATPGAGQAEAIPSRAVAGPARRAGAETAAESPTTGPSTARFLPPQPPWTKGGALGTGAPRADEAARHEFDATRLRQAETHGATGLAEPGAVPSRNRDGAFCGPGLTPTRTRAVMDGASHRDVRHVREGDGG